MKKSWMQKLNSSKGASMIIALVFMMICVFVGGSVLAAATMNAYRIEHMKDQDEYLNQRSAAILVADELQTPADQPPLRLTAYFNKINRQHIEIEPSGRIKRTTEAKVPGTNINSKDTVYELVFEFREDKDNFSAFKRTLFESAIRGYYQDLKATESTLHPDDVSMKIETYDSVSDKYIIETRTVGDMWVKEPAVGEKVTDKIHITVTEDGDGTPFTEFDSHFWCDHGKVGLKGYKYDYYVNFGDESQLEVELVSSVGTTTIPEVVEIVDAPETANANDGWETKTVTSRTIITWASPRIEKGHHR